MNVSRVSARDLSRSTQITRPNANANNIAAHNPVEPKKLDRCLHEIVEHIQGIKRIQNSYEQSNYQIHFEKMPKFYAEHRQKFFQYYCEVVEWSQCEFAIANNAFDILDRYFSCNHQSLDHYTFKDQQRCLDKAAITTLSLAIKNHQSRSQQYWDLDNYIRHLIKKIGIGCLITEETTLLRTLNFQVNSPNCYDYALPLFHLVFSSIQPCAALRHKQKELEATMHDQVKFTFKEIQFTKKFRGFEFEIGLSIALNTFHADLENTHGLLTLVEHERFKSSLELLSLPIDNSVIKRILDDLPLNLKTPQCDQPTG